MSRFRKRCLVVVVVVVVGNLRRLPCDGPAESPSRRRHDPALGTSVGPSAIRQTYICICGGRSSSPLGPPRSPKGLAAADRAIIPVKWNKALGLKLWDLGGCGDRWWWHGGGS